MGKVPHDDNEASRDIEKSPAHVIDVLMHVDSATRHLGANPFELLFFLPDMHQEKKYVVYSPPDLQEEKNDVPFFLLEVHPLALLHTSSAFVLKRRTFVHNPARAVDNDNTAQFAEMAPGWTSHKSSGKLRYVDPANRSSCAWRRSGMTFTA